MNLLKNIKILILFISVFTILDLNAQQDAQYTHYMFNPLGINPAYAGSRDALSIVGLYRSQWIGVNDAPVTQTFSAHTPLGQEKKLGLGLSFVNDQVGYSKEQYLNIDVSYTINLGESSKLAFGVKGVGNMLNVDLLSLSTGSSQIDPSLTQNIENEFNPNFGAGLYFYTDKMYIGLSAPNIMETEHLNTDNNTLNIEKRSYYALAGYVFDLSEKIKFKPAFMVKNVEGAPIQVDGSGSFMINNKFIIGGAYRYDQAVSALAGFQITPGLLLGYAYDYELTDISNISSGSHEMFLRFELNKGDGTNPSKNKKSNELDKILDPRFF